MLICAAAWFAHTAGNRLCFLCSASVTKPVYFYSHPSIWILLQAQSVGKRRKTSFDGEASEFSQQSTGNVVETGICLIYLTSKVLIMIIRYNETESKNDALVTDNASLA